MRTTLLFTTLASTTNAWWNNGHMITARVAYDHLQQVAPEVIPKAEKFLEPLSYMNQHEANHTFVECATFADDIKDKGMSDQSPWHFVDQPYFDHFNTTVFPEKFNVTWSIDYMTKNLKADKKNEDTGVMWELGDAFNLRLLIHYIGDMHQPLHTVSRYAEDFPNGDMGGNLFMLEEKEDINELHALWDSTIYEFDQDFPQPLSEDSWNELGDISEMVRSEHPVDEDQMVEDLKKHESKWADEGYELATSVVYNITQNSMPTDEYVSTARAVVHRQLAKGGYRLANTLIDIFAKQEEMEMDAYFLQE